MRPIVGKKQYKSVKDLDGKKVGTPGIGTIHDAVLGYIQQTMGMKFEHVPGQDHRRRRHDPEG